MDLARAFSNFALSVKIMLGDMEADFGTLMDYLERKKQLQVTVEESSAKKKQCVHEGIETDEDYVCHKCGLVLGQIYQPDVHWLDHAMMVRQYTDMDRLNAVDKTLAAFLEKIGWCDSLPLHEVQELLKAMKYRSGYRSLNYAIALTCILDEDRIRQKIAPFLPRSNAAWARSLAVLDPVPQVFIRSWLKNLLNPTSSRNLTQTQRKRFNEGLILFDETQLQVMFDLIRCYGVKIEKSRHLDIDTLPLELKHVLHKFALAVRSKVKK